MVLIWRALCCAIFCVYLVLLWLLLSFMFGWSLLALVLFAQVYGIWSTAQIAAIYVSFKLAFILLKGVLSMRLPFLLRYVPIAKSKLSGG